MNFAIRLTVAKTFGAMSFTSCAASVNPFAESSKILFLRGADGFDGIGDGGVQLVGNEFSFIRIALFNRLLCQS
jgi:hypothetical protein